MATPLPASAAAAAAIPEPLLRTPTCCCFHAAAAEAPPELPRLLQCPCQRRTSASASTSTSTSTSTSACASTSPMSSSRRSPPEHASQCYRQSQHPPAGVIFFHLARRGEKCSLEASMRPSAPLGRRRKAARAQALQLSMREPLDETQATLLELVASLRLFVPEHGGAGYGGIAVIHCLLTANLPIAVSMSSSRPARRGDVSDERGCCCSIRRERRREREILLLVLEADEPPVDGGQLWAAASPLVAWPRSKTRA